MYSPVSTQMFRISRSLLLPLIIACIDIARMPPAQDTRTFKVQGSSIKILNSPITIASPRPDTPTLTPKQLIRNSDSVGPFVLIAKLDGLMHGTKRERKETARKDLAWLEANFIFVMVAGCLPKTFLCPNKRKKAITRNSTHARGV